MPGNTVSEGPAYSAGEVHSGFPAPLPVLDAGTPAERPRRSGLDFVGDIAWGTHLCHFYQTKQDLIEIAVPYLRAGLENNEFCLWIVSDLLDPVEARAAMTSIWPGCHECAEIGQMRFLDHHGWYYRQGPFEPRKMADTTLDIVKRALQNEYAGMRIFSSMSWAEKSDWGMLAEFESNLGRLEGAPPLLTICSYNLDKCSPAEVDEVMRRHAAAIRKEEGEWRAVRLSARAAVLERPEAAEEVPEEAAEEVPAEAVEEAPEEAVEEVPAEAVEEVLEEAVEEVPAEAVEEVPAEAVEEAPAEAVEEAPTEAVEEAAAKAVQEAAAKAVQEAAAKAAEEAAAKATEEMHVVFEGVRDAIVILDMAGKVVRVNRRVPELFGYPESAMVGKQFALLRMFPPSRAAEMFSAQARTLAGHDVPDFDIEANSESGGKLDVEICISPMKRESRVVGAVAVIRDITTRRQAEEKLRAAQQRNQLVVQNANEGIMVIQDGTVRFANPKMLEMIGYSDEEILMKPVTDLVHPDDRRSVTAGQFKRLRGEELSHVQDLRIVDKGGNTRWAEFNAVLFAWDGRPADLYFVNDITQRKKAQEALIQGQRNYKHLFESTLDGLVVVDAESRKVALANPACATIFGFASPADMVEADLLASICDDERERVVAMLDKAMAGNDVHWVEELRAATRSGAEIWISAVCVQTEFQGRPAVLISVKDTTDQKRAEAELSRSQTDLQVVFDGVLDGIVLLDDFSRVVRVNRRVLDLTEFPSDEVVGHQFDGLKMFPPEAREKIRSVLQDQLSGKDAGHFELEGRTASDKVLNLEARITTLRQGDVAQGAIAVLRDISYRRLAEDSLRRQERYYRALIENTSDAIAVVGRDGTVKYQSPSCHRILGYRVVDEAGAKPVDAFDYLHPDENAGMKERFARLLETEGASERSETRVRHRDGTWRTIEATSTNLLHDPSVEGIVVNLRDITERQQAEEALRESEKRYRLLAENASDVIWIVDMDLRFTYISPSMARMIGYTPDEVAGEKATSLMTMDSVDAVSQALAEELAAEEGRSGDPQRSRVLQIEMKCRHGQNVWVELKASFLRGPDGKAIGVLGVAREITERRKAQQSLEESERRYRLLAENATDVIWTMDMDRRLAYVSPSVTRLSGFTVEETLAMPIREAFTPDSVAALRKSLKGAPGTEACGTGQDERSASTLELELKRKDGSTIWTETKLSPVLGPDGSGAGWIGITRDISDRRKSAQALFDSEKRYRLLAENVSDVIWVTDLNLRPTYISPSMERLLGYKPEESLASGMDQMVTRESAQRATERMAQALSLLKKDPNRPLKPGNVELEFKRKDGSTLWVDATAAVVHDSQGQPVEFMGVLHDITERRKSEKAVSDSEGRFRSLIESTSDWVWEVNEKLVYTYVSRKITEILGFEPEEVIGKAPVDLMPLKEANRAARVFSTALTDKKPFAFVETVCLHKDGHKVVLETSGVPFFDANGGVSGFRGIARDVTERKRAEEEAQESFRKLQRTVEGTIQAIALTVETRDPYTAGHQRRVTKLAYAIAQEMSLPNDQIQRVRIAGLLHDLGKIFIPTEILSKPGQLTEVEFAIIKSHPQAGHEILKNIEFPWPISDIVIQHHERMNGTGYPAGLKGDDIVIEARILAVADVVEAMSSHRPYRPAIGLEKALKEIVNNKETLYDASVVDACMRVFGSGVFKFDD